MHKESKEIKVEAEQEPRKTDDSPSTQLCINTSYMLIVETGKIPL